jgi:large subunit ribosomal protein L10
MNVRGTNINDMNQVRWAMLPAGGKAKRIKNTLAKIALKDLPKRQPIENIIHGNVIFLYLGTGSDPMEIFRIAKSLEMKFDSLAILGGAFGDTLLTRDGVLKVTEIPTLETLRGDLIGALISPQYSLAAALNMPKQAAAALARGLQSPAMAMARSGTLRAKQLEDENAKPAAAESAAEPADITK